MVVLSSQCGENTAFYPVFPLAGATAKAFCRLSLWNFKEKASTIFYNTAFKNSPRTGGNDGHRPFIRAGQTLLTRGKFPAKPEKRTSEAAPYRERPSFLSNAPRLCFTSLHAQRKTLIRYIRGSSGYSLSTRKTLFTHLPGSPCGGCNLVPGESLSGGHTKHRSLATSPHAENYSDIFEVPSAPPHTENPFYTSSRLTLQRVQSRPRSPLSECHTKCRPLELPHTRGKAASVCAGRR